MMVRMLTTKMRIRKSTAIFEILLLVGLAIPAGIQRYESKQKAEIQSQYDTRIDNFENNKDLALSYLNVLTINNSQKYSEVKNSLSPILSESLQSQLFGNEKYTAADKPGTTYKVLDVTGTIGNNGAEVYKIQYELTENKTTKQCITLITVENGKIVSAENL